NPSAISRPPKLRQTTIGNLKQLPLNPHQLKPTSLHNSRGGSVDGSLGEHGRFLSLAAVAVSGDAYDVFKLDG
ncbi:hypothetical protein, partial [Burkholderia sp. TSV86]|uniref:hypothetical protein n=1 Tax=Burkholderia sp. TSV86 TaxID=1385594 RepID=UPI000B31C338